MKKLLEFSEFALKKSNFIYGGESSNQSQKVKSTQSAPETVTRSDGSSMTCSDEIITETDDNGKLLETCENWTCN